MIGSLRRLFRREPQPLRLVDLAWRLRLLKLGRFVLTVGNDCGTIRGELTGDEASRLAKRIGEGVTNSTDADADAARELIDLIEQACRSGVRVDDVCTHEKMDLSR